MTATMGHLPYGYLLVPALLLLATSCKKDDEPPAAVSGNSVPSYPSTVVDIDGNVYFVVSIGDQRWMAENLRTTHYADGTEIPLGVDPISWTAAGTSSTPARCAYQHNATNAATYGYLYNWYAVTNPHGICPQGWHVPTDAEWQYLIVSLGADASTMDGVAQNVGGRLKSTSTLWQQPNFGATNTSGFSGLPGGYRNGGSGDFSALGYFGIWWSIDPGNNPDIAWYMRLNHDYVGVSRSSLSKSYGYCVRCLQD